MAYLRRRIATNGYLRSARALCSTFLNGKGQLLGGCVSPTNDIQFRNQYLVKTSIPTAHTYVSPADRTDPNFVIQYECKTKNFLLKLLVC